MKSKSLFAVLAGSGVGIVAALAGRGAGSGGEPPPLPSAAARPVKPLPERPLATPSGDPSAAVPPANVGEPMAGTEVPITSREELEAAAVACEAKDAGACRRAATAAESGQVPPKDLERAKTLRKIELTLLVRGCEKGAVDACLTLADRYLRGDGLEQSDRTATALIEHAKELCAKRDADACRSLPKN